MSNLFSAPHFLFRSAAAVIHWKNIKLNQEQLYAMKRGALGQMQKSNKYRKTKTKNFQAKKKKKEKKKCVNENKAQKTLILRVG